MTGVGTIVADHFATSRGGDQLYCDSIVREPELQDWVHEGNKDKKMRMPLTPEIEFAVDRYYFSSVLGHTRVPFRCMVLTIHPPLFRSAIGITVKCSERVRLGGRTVPSR
jgi:hypothetical protein